MRISDWSSDVCSSDLVPFRYNVPWKCVPISSRIASRLEIAAESCLPSSVWRSEEHTSELQSLMRISYAVFCLKKKQNKEHIKKSRKYKYTTNTIQTNINHNH